MAAGEEEEEEGGFLVDSARLSVNGTTEEEEDHDQVSEERDKGALVRSLASHSKEVDIILRSAAKVQAISVDLSKKGLVKVPEELYGMDHVEFLYLEGNMIQSVPADLFDRLANVKWLDLRSNNIHSLPTAIGRHRCLKTLLLEGNQIAELPPEMGQLKTLTGLNLRGNPLEFPPPKVIAKGVKEIMRYLKEALNIKGRRLQLAELRIEDLTLSDTVTHSSDGSETEDYERQGRGGGLDGRSANRIQSSGRLSARSSVSNGSDLEFPRPRSVSLHKHMTYEEYRQLQYQKFKRAGALGVLGKDKRKKKRQKKLRSPPVIDPIQSKMAEERRLAKMTQLKQKQLAMEQRRKDQQMLDDWRQETKDMQRKHYMRAIRNAQQDFVDPDLKMPYDTDPEFMRIMNREDMIKEEVKHKHQALKNKLTSEDKMKLDRAKMERDRQLISKIKEHTQKVQDRKQRPRGNPQQEMEAARRDLAEAQQLQQSLSRRKDNLEYRFRAFTGDDFSALSVTNTSGYRPHHK